MGRQKTNGGNTKQDIKTRITKFVVLTILLIIAIFVLVLGGITTGESDHGTRSHRHCKAI